MYWDDVEQRIYWIDRRSGYKQIKDGPLRFCQYLVVLRSETATFSTIDQDKPLLGVFARIEDILHSVALGPNKCFTIMLQLLLQSYTMSMHTKAYLTSR